MTQRNPPLVYIGKRPTRAHHDDAGFDLEVSGNHTIEPKTFGRIPLQTRLMAPDGIWLMLLGRSSTFANRGLLTTPGVIDHGYTGPLYAVVYNLNEEPVHIQHGERIVQIVPYYCEADHITITKWPDSDFPPTDRGAGGFGSSGT